MTLPRPVTKDKYGKRTSDYTQYDWIKQLFEEVSEVINARTKEQRAEELIDVITTATSWLNAIGYDVEARAELQRQVNDKNLQRGYFEE